MGRIHSSISHRRAQSRWAGLGSPFRLALPYRKRREIADVARDVLSHRKTTDLLRCPASDHCSIGDHASVLLYVRTGGDGIESELMKFDSPPSSPDDQEVRGAGERGTFDTRSILCAVRVPGNSTRGR